MSILARVLAVLLIAAGAVLMLPFTPAEAATVNINAGDFWFCDSSHQGNVCTTNITAGDTVTWHFSNAFLMHTSTNTTVPWNSGKVANGGTFSQTFSSPGTFAYICSNHPTLMMGTIVVSGSGVGGETQLTDSVTGALQAPRGAGSHLGMWLGLAALAGGVITLTGAAWFGRRRLAA